VEIRLSVPARHGLSAKDLIITKENDRVVVAFAYDKEVELVKPVFLLIKFEGRSN